SRELSGGDAPCPRDAMRLGRAPGPAGARRATMGRTLVELRRYPSAVAGLAIIGLLVGISMYTVIAIPYHDAIRLWRGGEQLWLENPRNARPVWMNLLPGVNLPRPLVVSSASAPRH